MFPYLYRAYIISFGEDNLAEVVIDLGFHVFTRRWLAVPDGVDRERILYRWILALVSEGDGSSTEDIRLLTGAEGESPLPPAGEGPPELWRYPARIMHVVDGDTVDAEIHIGFGIVVRHRLRLAGIQVPERGEAARLGYLTTYYGSERNGHCVEIVSSRHGKWRRWLAEVYFADSDRTLNQELVEHGYAVVWDGRSSLTPGVSRMLVELSDDTRGRLTEASATEGLAPGQVAGRIVTKYFDSDGSGDSQ